jgi:hypothetical protein
VIDEMPLSAETRIPRGAIVDAWKRTVEGATRERTAMSPESPRLFFPMLAVFAVALLLFVISAAARADSTPVGVLPGGTVSKVKTQRGLLVAVALPRPRRPTGLAWRIARSLDPKILRQLDEVETASSVVAVFQVVGYGTTSIVFALTRGDASPTALRSHTTKILVPTDEVKRPPGIQR